MKRIAIACFMLFNAMRAGAQDTAPNPYENWGICPFECCTYREWTAEADVLVHEKRSDHSPVVFAVRRGESIDGLTGVVVTENPAVIEVKHAVRDGYIKGSDQPQLSLMAGERIYMLAPLGEGAYLFWYKGKVYQAGSMELQATPGVEGIGMNLTWWKLVRNKAGKTGWTKSSRFSNVDSCG